MRRKTLKQSNVAGVAGDRVAGHEPPAATQAAGARCARPPRAGSQNPLITIDRPDWVYGPILLLLCNRGPAVKPARPERVRLRAGLQAVACLLGDGRLAAGLPLRPTA